MTVQINTTAEINGVRFVDQGSHPSTPAAGHALLYIITGSASPGLYMKTDQGQQIGPFITGSVNIGAGALILVEEHDASNSASLDFSASISVTYDEYAIELVDVVPQTNNVDFYMRVSTTGTYDSGNNYANNTLIIATSGNAQYSSTTTAIVTRGAGEISNDTGKSVCGSLKLFSPASSTNKKVTGNITWQGAANYANSVVHGIYVVSAAITGFQFLFSSGNIVSGSIRVYGIVK